MKSVLKIVSLFVFSFNVNAQILNVPQVIQEQDQWCWAGVSKSVLDYYGFPLNQCEIAEYARQSISWYNFGSTDCCVNPNLGCNYWNYNWGNAGSIQDILIHFGNIQNTGQGSALTLNQITTQISNGRPFIIRWGWTSGGGHFVVGHGITGSDVSYMNPWPGEGLHIGTYTWLKSGSNHTWTHTNIISTNLNVNNLSIDAEFVKIFPNPTNSLLNVSTNEKVSSCKIYNSMGQILKKVTTNDLDFNIDISPFAVGVYLIEFEIQNKLYYKKIIKE